MVCMNLDIVNENAGQKVDKLSANFHCFFFVPLTTLLEWFVIC